MGYISIYACITIILSINNIIFYTNIINPLFWGGIFTYLIHDVKHYYVRFSSNKKYLAYTIIVVCVYLIIFFYFGFIFGFVKSPYNHKIGAILENFIIYILPIIGIEFTRFVLVNRNKKNKKILIFITIILILLEIQYNTIKNLYYEKEEFFKYILSNVIPLISYSSLYTYLILKGLYLLPIVCRVIHKFITFTLPLLPKTNWFMIGTIGVISPTIIYVLFKYVFMKQSNDIRKKQKNLGTKISYIITISLSIILVCFMLGIFKYEPIAILSNSMTPTFNRGDVLIYKKLNEDELKKIPKTSIIVYSIGEQNIAHRIVEVIKEKDTILYRTKGDHNNASDLNLVKTDQIKGIYMFHIKYIGYPSVWLYDYFNSEEET